MDPDPPRRTTFLVAGLAATALLASLDLAFPHALFAWGFLAALAGGAAALVARGESPAPAAASESPPAPALYSLFRECLKLGLTGFGGGLAVLSQIEQRLVERRGWVTTRRFLEAAALAQSLPGAVATNALAFLGLRMGGLWGALTAVTGFVLPSFAMLLLFALLYPMVRPLAAVDGLFRGLNPAVTGLVAATAIRLGGRVALTDAGEPAGWRALWSDRIGVAVMVAAAITVAFAGVGLVEVIVVSGLIGLLRATRLAEPFGAIEGHWNWLMRRVWEAARGGAAALGRPWWRRWRDPSGDDLLGLAPLGLLLAPVAVPGWMHRLEPLGAVCGVFLRAGALTFGGGFVMIPQLEAELVRAHGWLAPQSFADAVALGQVTPGPVVITATFIGYSVAGLAGAVLGTVAVFTPAFLMVLIVGTSVDRFRHNRALQAFLHGIQPAVVGLLFAAVVSLARHGIKGWPGAVIAVTAFLLLLRWKLNPAHVLAGACAVGLIWAWVAP